MLMGRCPAVLTANSLLWEVRAVFIQIMYYVYPYLIRFVISFMSLNFALKEGMMRVLRAVIYLSEEVLIKRRVAHYS